MASLTILSAKYRISTNLLKRLFDGEGFDYDDDGFEIEKCHQKALNEIARKRISPYVLAYVLWCREMIGPDEMFVRYDNIVAVADARGFCLGDAISDIYPKHIYRDRLLGGQNWLDRATATPFDRDAVERIARWCRQVLTTAPPFSLEYPFLATRLLFSLPLQEMPNYPKKVQRALNLAVHYGFLDGCFTLQKDRDGTERKFFHRPKFDL